MRYLWAAPTTFVGLLLVPLALVGRGRVAVVSGVLEASGGLLDILLRRFTLLRGGVSALALGYVVLARNLECAERTRQHERVHVRQCEQWGPFFLPAYLAASLWALLRHGNLYRDNWFERVAQGKSHPPRTALHVAAGTIARDDRVADSPTGKELTTAAGKRTRPSDRSGEQMALATFGAGCFWGVEAAFRQVEGVTDAAAGYLGGHLESPTYEDVCSGRTGHAEVVQVEFDPAVVSYQELLDVFWKSHDPTTLNRQGPDVGAQYRSAVFYHTPEQADSAAASKQALAESGAFSSPIVTEITPATTFYRAEDYHQRYLEKRGLASCSIPPRNP